MASLVQVCRRDRPDVLVAHGFSDHLWGRYAGLWAGVPHLVHVEHNSKERYTRWRLAQSRWLAQRTAAIVGCSEGVKATLLALGFPSHKVYAISNGIVLHPFAAAPERPYLQRAPGVVMTARFARQKDHATLLRAVALLRDRGLRPAVWLAGGGSARYQRRAQQLCDELRLNDQVHFLGLHRDVPNLLMGQQIFVLSSHYEGMPLSLVEAMAAGCAVVGSAVPGVQEVIQDGVNGRLFAHEDPEALAQVIQTLLERPEQAGKMADQARATALDAYSQDRMVSGYERLLLSLR
jgi:glycosyltransferase involved in cell wall biosynthesis